MYKTIDLGDRIDKSIATFGFAIISGSTPKGTPYAYTVGLNPVHGHFDMAVAGIDVDLAADYLTKSARLVVNEGVELIQKRRITQLCETDICFAKCNLDRAVPDNKANLAFFDVYSNRCNDPELCLIVRPDSDNRLATLDADVDLDFAFTQLDPFGVWHPIEVDSEVYIQRSAS